MPVANPFITDGATFVTPFGLVFTFAMGVMIVVLPRRYALLPVILLTCYMTMGMRVVVAGLNFTMLRILLIFGWVRLVARREFRQLRINQLDKGIVWFTVVSVVTYTILWGDYDAFKEKLGLAYNTLGFYFLFRFMLKDLEDVWRVCRMTALVIGPLAVAMVVEKVTGRNSFAVFGGVGPITAIRDGVVRCQGPFAHPILSGTFGGCLIAYFIALWMRGPGSRVVAAIGIISASVITFVSGSSGPLLAYVASVGALLMYPMRMRMRWVRWGIVGVLAALQMLMKAPVWFIMAKIDVFSGSTGFHRAYLIDRAIANLPDWWLVGTHSTAAWADADQHLYDVTNQYITYGADGGLLTMILFICLIVYGFRLVGQSVRLLDRRELFSARVCIWAMGAALLSHTISYLSVSYFDQNVINWYLLLAMISTAAAQARGLARQIKTVPDGRLTSESPRTLALPSFAGEAPNRTGVPSI